MVARKIRNAKDARTCLAAAASAGQVPREWAHQNGVNARSLHMWRVLLAQGRGNTESPAEPLRLVELVPLPRPAPARARYVVSCGQISLELDERFDDDAVARLLRLVRAC